MCKLDFRLFLIDICRVKRLKYRCKAWRFFTSFFKCNMCNDVFVIISYIKLLAQYVKFSSVDIKIRYENQKPRLCNLQYIGMRCKFLFCGSFIDLVLASEFLVLVSEF